MPRKKNDAIEAGYLRSMWEEIAEIEREHQMVFTMSIVPTVQRGVFNVRMAATEVYSREVENPLSHSIAKRLPDGGSLPFAGALWDLSRKLCDQVAEAVDARAAQVGEK